MALSTSPYKGTRDFYPDEMRIRQWMFSKWKQVVQSYGYEAYDAPVLEPVELYSAKTGDEIVDKQSYRFEDRGGRDVMIRPEMTPTVSRLVAARRQELGFPVRWFSLANFMRYERPQRGRLREFWQLNVDVFGVRTIDAELELIQIANRVMRSFGAKSDMYTIKINSRRLVALLMADYLRLDAAQSQQMSKLLDKKDKISTEAFFASAKDIINDAVPSAMDRLNVILEAKSMADLPDEIRQSNPVKEIQILFTLLGENGIKNARFDVTLMRGLDYYTDIVFEVFDMHPDNNRSIFGGGRYDGLVGMFGVEPLPTAGFAIGDVPFHNFLESHNLLPELASPTELYIVVIGDVLRQSQGVAELLRDEGLNVAVDVTGRKAEKQIRSAVKKGIRRALFVGERELDEEVFTMRDLVNGEEQQLSLERVISEVKRPKK